MRTAGRGQFFVFDIEGAIMHSLGLLAQQIPNGRITASLLRGAVSDPLH